jgi:hypothetical protein
MIETLLSGVAADQGAAEMPEPFVDVRPPLPKTPPLAHSPKQDSKTNFAKQLDRMLWDML